MKAQGAEGKKIRKFKNKEYSFDDFQKGSKKKVRRGMYDSYDDHEWDDNDYDVDYDDDDNN